MWTYILDMWKRWYRGKSVLLMVAVSQRLETGELTTAERRICRTGRALRSIFQWYTIVTAVSLGQIFQILKGLTMRPKYAKSYCTPQNEPQRKIRRKEKRKGYNQFRNKRQSYLYWKESTEIYLLINLASQSYREGNGCVRKLLASIGFQTQW